MNAAAVLRRLALALLLALPAAAQASDLDDCRSTGNIANDARIKACSAVIDGKQAAGADLAIVYTFRAIAQSHEAKLDAAIADYTRAIELSPGRWSLLYMRGMAYGQKQGFKAALADDRAALALDPPPASADMIRQNISLLEKKVQ